MENNVNNLSEGNLLELSQTFNMLIKAGSIEIESFKKNWDLENKKRYEKLRLSPAQKIYMSALIQQIPSVAASVTIAQAYTVKFPKGLPHALTVLQQGGFGTQIRGGRGFLGSASLYSMMPQATILGAFTAMSIVSGQYFLKQINEHLQKINQTLDEIIKILHEEKRAELLSELAFVKNAYKNYCSIMGHEQQRVATITSLQQSKKVAMKHINFYLADLSGVSSGKTTDTETPIDMKNGVDLAVQLYVLSSLMEIYYAQNFDSDYLDYIKSDLIDYVYKCKNQLQDSFSKLSVNDIHDNSHNKLGQMASETGKALINRFQGKKQEEPIIEEKTYKNQYEMIADALKDDEGWVVSRKTVEDAFKAFTKSQTYYLSDEGDMYIKI